ncbi:unnamed protein product [Caenorhabditis sp. 36 PRJEB53466]|nr:unnamed protein product [Caenorhabditis sp. 36 PRJEB53466]
MWKPASNQPARNRIMDHSKRTIGKGEALQIDPALRGETSFSVYRSHSSGHEPFAPSPGSSIGASVSMFSSRNSEAEVGDSEELDGVRTIMMHIGVGDMVADKEIQTRYPEFYQFLLTEQPTWFEPAPYNGTVYRVHQTTAPPENQRKLRKELSYEMLDLMYRFYRQKHVNAQRKRENKELVEANQQLRVAAVQMFTKAEQEEEYISNSLLKKIQQLNQDKDYLVKKYQKDEESLTKSLMANVAKIPDVHADETEKLMADKQAEIESLRAYCSRAEKNYQEELMRLRAEKVDHESALEQEQELLINTLGKRMSQMNEEKRKMQQVLEKAYVNGFVDYDETVAVALHASAARELGTSSSSQPLLRGVLDASITAAPARQQAHDVGALLVQNQKLRGQANQANRNNEATQNEIKKLNQRMSKMEAIMDAIRTDALRGDGTLAWRLAALSQEHDSEEIPPKGGHGAERRAHGASPPTNVVIGQPSSSRSTTEIATPQAVVAPILATVFPTQRTTPSRPDRPDQQN